MIAEIDEILRNPVNEESAGRAYGIVSNIFEDVIGAPFYTAIESLNAPRQSQALHDRRPRSATVRLLE